MAAYKMTPARRAAIRKAQAASARKRKGRAANRNQSAAQAKRSARNKKIVKGVAIGAAAAGIGVAAVYGGKEYQKSDHNYVRHTVRKSVKKASAKQGSRLTRDQRRAVAKRVRPLASSNAKRRTVKRAPGKAVVATGRKVRR